MRVCSVSISLSPSELQDLERGRELIQLENPDLRLNPTPQAGESQNPAVLPLVRVKIQQNRLISEENTSKTKKNMSDILTVLEIVLGKTKSQEQDFIWNKHHLQLRVCPPFKCQGAGPITGSSYRLVAISLESSEHVRSGVTSDVVGTEEARVFQWEAIQCIDVRKIIFFPLTTASRILLARMEQNKTQEKTRKAIN